MPLRSTNNEITLEDKPWNDWTLYAELQGRKTDGRQVVNGSVGHQELAAWVEGLGL